MQLWEWDYKPPPPLIKKFTNLRSFEDLLNRILKHKNELEISASESFQIELDLINNGRKRTFISPQTDIEEFAMELFVENYNEIIRTSKPIELRIKYNNFYLSLQELYDLKIK